jgi:hypothetical protein
MHEIKDPADAMYYYGEVLNPLGYVTFALQEDKDWIEKAEHTAVASIMFSAPLHIGAAISTGGYRANLPPGIHARLGAALKLKHDFTKAVVQHGYKATRAIGPGLVAGAFAASLMYGTQKILQYLNPDMPAFLDLRGMDPSRSRK